MFNSFYDLNLKPLMTQSENVITNFASFSSKLKSEKTFKNNE